jgi:dephospho-CoA kinase
MPECRSIFLPDRINYSFGFCKLSILCLTAVALTFIDRVLVVDVNPEIQIERLMARDGSSREQAELALASQAGREQRFEIADDVLINSGSLNDAIPAVAQLHRKYIGLANSSEHQVDTK